MATYYSSWLKRENTNVCRAVIEATVTSSTATAATIQLVTKLQYGNLHLWPTELATSLSIATSIGGSAASTTATVSYVRGGTQTLNTRSVTITKTHASQNVAVSGTVTLTYRGSSQHVALAASGTQAVSAKTSYAVRYYANGGDSSAMPAAQTKWYGESLTLSSTVPTRAGFTFLGWNTNAKGTGTHYAPGATYTGNAALKLYAMWLSVSVPTMEVLRTDDAGTETDEGTYGTLAASWQSGGTVPATVTVTASNPTVGSITLNGDTSGSYAAGGSASGNVDALFGGSFSLDTRYRVVVSAVVTTPYNVGTTLTATAVAYVEYAYITIDVRKGGHGVTFGGPAVEDGLHSYMPATFHDTLTAPNIGAITTADGTVSVASGTGTAICSVTLDPGTYIIEGNLAYQTNATGRRIATLSVTAGNATSASILSQTGVEVPATGGGYTALHTTWMTKRTAQTTVYLNAYQDSGSTISATGYIRAMRIA